MDLAVRLFLSARGRFFQQRSVLTNDTIRQEGNGMKKVDCIVAAPHFLTMEGEGVGYRAHHAMAIDRGKIVGMAPRDAIFKDYRADRVIDNAARVVLPGFIDAHSHPSGAGVNELVQVNADLRSVAAIKSAIASGLSRRIIASNTAHISRAYGVESGCSMPAPSQTRCVRRFRA